MPLYTYECPNCQQRKDEYRVIAKRDDAPYCSAHPRRRRMTRVLVGHRVAVFNPYRTVGAERGRLIRNSAEHKAYLRFHGYEEVGNDKSMAPPDDDEIYEQQQIRKRDEMERSFEDLKHAPAD